jgi:hypothetical protein
VLVEALLPRFFGDVHTFSDAGYWGQPFFPDGYPYLLGLYVGVPLALLAACAGRGQRRLWLFVALGALLSMGDHGPLGPLVAPLLTWMRAPVKLLFWSTLALSLLAGRGLDRAGAVPARLALAPGVVVLSLGLVLFRWPTLPASAFGALLPELRDPRAAFVIAHQWPARFAASGAIALAVGLMLRRRLAAGGAFAGPPAAGLLAGLLAGLDLLGVNGAINRTAPATFYELAPPLQQLVGGARAAPGRWFSYGAAACAPLRWKPELARANSDVALYSAERQSLLPRTHVLDGLEAVYDEDRTGTAPPGATLDALERTPARYRQTHPRLRLAGTRWLLSFRELPEDLLRLHGEASVPELLDPLRLYELRDALPRAFWVGEHELVPDRSALWRRVLEGSFDPLRVVLLEHAPAPIPGAATAGARGGEAASAVRPARVSAEPIDPHTLRIRVDSPPGFVVVLDGHHRDWNAKAGGAELPVLRANFRYMAVQTPGGPLEILLHYSPRWRPLGLALLALGAAAATVLACARARGPAPPQGGEGAAPSGPAADLRTGSTA